MKKVYLIIIGLVFVYALSAQTSALRQRLYFGGSFGLQFGTITDIEVSPLAGFRLTPALSVAAGPSLEYYRDPYFKTLIFGGRGYLRYTLIRDISKIIPLGTNTGLYAQLENDVLLLENQYFGFSGATEGRFMNNTLLVGGGISQQISQRGRMNFSILFVANNPEFDFYDNPVIRIGFNF
jgi:hypothetical protein